MIGEEHRAGVGGGVVSDNAPFLNPGGRLLCISLIFL